MNFTTFFFSSSFWCDFKKMIARVRVLVHVLRSHSIVRQFFFIFIHSIDYVRCWIFNLSVLFYFVCFLYFFFLFFCILSLNCVRIYGIYTYILPLQIDCARVLFVHILCDLISSQSVTNVFICFLPLFFILISFTLCVLSDKKDKQNNVFRQTKRKKKKTNQLNNYQF